MQKFRRHVDQRIVEYLLTAVIILVVVAVNSLESISWSVVPMNYWTLGVVIFAVVIIQVKIMSTLIAIAPKNNGGVVGIADYHFLYQFCTRFCTVGILPAGQFIEHVYSQRIAHF